MKGGKSLNDFNFGTLIGRFFVGFFFLRDGAASTAVKGFNLLSLQRAELCFILEIRA